MPARGQRSGLDSTQRDSTRPGTSGGANTAGLAAGVANAQAQVNRQYGTQQQQAARAARSYGNPYGGQGGAGDTPPTITRTDSQPFTISTPGSVPVSGGATGGYVDDSGIITHQRASPGQLFSALTRIMTGPSGVATALADIASSDQYGRSLLGASLDKSVGGVPDVGYRGGNHIANPYNQPDRPSGDTRLQDRSVGAGTAALTGDGPAGGGAAEFSDVMLSDRRKPYGAGTKMILSL